MFSSLKKLPLTVDLVPGECATSLGSRLARRNGVQRLITFCSDVGIDYFALANGDPQEVTRLGALAGVDPAALPGSHSNRRRDCLRRCANGRRTDEHGSGARHRGGARS